MTTAGNIITRALRPMRDPGQDFFPDAELIDYINEAIMDLAIRQQLFEYENNSPAASGGAVAPPTSTTERFLAWRWIRDSAGVELNWIDETSYMQLIADGYSDETAPLVAAFHGQAWIVPAPDDGTVYLIGYYGVPGDLTAAGDTIPTPIEYDRKLVHFLRAQCYYRLAEMDLANTEMAQYETGLNDPKVMLNRQRPGAQNWAVEGGIFDLDPERAF